MKGVGAPEAGIEMRVRLLQVLQHCQVVKAFRTFKSPRPHQCCTLSLHWRLLHHWSSHAMRELQLSARDPDIVALLSSDVVFDSFVVVKSRALMDHARVFSDLHIRGAQSLRVNH